MERRGGYRPNAGRKPGKGTTLGAQQVARLRRKVKRYAREHGKDPDDVLLDIVYSKNEKTADVLAAIKLLKEYTAPKIVEGGEADRAFGPAVYLPGQRPQLEAVKDEETKAA
jgi:hypothetical protein